MVILGIETSCDECAVGIVKDGRHIYSNIVATQIDYHRLYNGVVPEIASRLHTQWILPVVKSAMEKAQITIKMIDGIAVTSKPGLVGSLLVGVNFAKGLACALEVPLAGVDHILAHLYAPHLEYHISYPYLGLIVSGGHTVICLVDDFDSVHVLGTTIDDACGEAFDKIAKYYEMGYPGGAAIDKLAKTGDEKAFTFPDPSLHKGDHIYDVSYSGLKTAVINQRQQFRNSNKADTLENIAASFQKAAVEILVKRIKRAVLDTGTSKIVVGGGVAANSRLRKELNAMKNVDIILPSFELCTDNGAMIAGIGYHYIKQGKVSTLGMNASPRVDIFKHRYP